CASYYSNYAWFAYW
nr:immunoglobulin heavy chain junction region [Mus musculus]